MWERSTEEHNGHTNYETWIFYTHITQTESLLNRALEIARPMVEEDYHPAVVGEEVVRRFREWATAVVYDLGRGAFRDASWKDCSLMLQDVGSWWRIDDALIGRHLVDYVKESVS